MMLVKVAWRNIWRNPVRSLVVITALALGLWAGLSVSAFVNGMMRQKIDSVISLEMSHFQFHQPGFREEMLMDQIIPDWTTIQQELLEDSLVAEVSGRTVSQMMVGTARATGAAKVVGVDPEAEKIVTRLNEKVIEGEYFGADIRNPALISRVMAEKYKVGIRSKIVLTFQDVDGNITAAAFRVIGIFDSGNKMFDNLNLFVLRSDIQSLAGLDNGVHEIAVLLKHHDSAEAMAVRFQSRYPDLEVLSWMDLAPGMRYMIETIKLYTVIIVGIILLALLFSIINTMLMAVLERVHEIGMLMAIGMTRPKIFGMIMLETIFLTIVGGPVGLLLAYLSITWFGSAGINLGNAAYGDFGFSNVIYPVLPGRDYMQVTLMIVVMAILAAIYPAWKGLQLKPVEAIRTA